ncbi:MAG: A/G-specific adenine glycosylase [Acidimicrobiia bacterium]|nr:A/G-specific adenine glycosylase [Acidimicrobiia bacterium]
MAQQTQISRVAGHFERFTHEFPTVEALAEAPLAQVVTAWSGLGYNRRARYLHAAAARIVTEGWPRTAAALQELPGVGPYTAAAVACFAFGEPVAAVDTNMKRVLSRWLGSPLDGTELTAAANAELDRARAAEWNQAVMDLGAGICSPRHPGCHACPVEEWCSDSSIYVPPPSQGRFIGSTRQARGAVLKVLIGQGTATEATLVGESGIDRQRLAIALAALELEGMIRQSNGAWALADG